MRVIKQAESAECGLACIAMVADHHGMRADLQWFRERCITSLRGMNIRQLKETAQKLGFNARALKIAAEDVRNLDAPCILHWEKRHFVVLQKVGRRHVWVIDPASGKKKLDPEKFSQSFSGVALELHPDEEFERSEQRATKSIVKVLGKVQGVKFPLFNLLAFAACLETTNLAFPIFGKKIMDEVLPHRDLDLLVSIMLAQSLVVAIAFSMQYLRQRTIFSLVSTVSEQWGIGLVKKLLSLPLPYFEKRSLGDISSRIASYTAVARTLTNGSVEIILDGVMGLISLVVLSMISHNLAALCLGFLVLRVASKLLFKSKLESLQSQSIVAAALTQSHLLESIRGITPIRLNGGEHGRLEKYRNLLLTDLSNTARLGSASSAVRLAGEFISSGRDLAITVAGIYAVVKGDLSLGSYIAASAYASTFYVRTVNLVDKIVEIRMLGVHLERIADIKLTKSEFEACSVPRFDCEQFAAPKIEFRNVSFRYADGEPMVIRNLSFLIAPGEAVAFKGASGIGKSTLLKLLLGIYRPTSGDILIDGIQLPEFGVQRLRAMSGTVLQEDTLFSGTIAENIAFFADELDLSKVERCARLAAIEGDILKFPMKYNTRVGDMGSTLSGGQLQRVILARALYRDPSLLLLDEATSHLDNDNEDIVNSALANFDATRIIIAHRISTLNKAERIIDLDLYEPHGTSPATCRLAVSRTVPKMPAEARAVTQTLPG